MILTDSDLVLVTGANGYIATNTIATLLKAGYSVRGTVRYRSSANGLLEALKDFANRIEIAEVPIFDVAGAFDNAVEGESKLGSVSLDNVC